MSVQLYKVTGAMAPATTRSPSGSRVRQWLFKGQMLPPDTPAVEIDHLLSVNLIGPIEVGPTASVEVESGAEPDSTDEPAGDGSGDGAAPEPDGGGDSGSAEPDSDVEAKRAEARAKLPADGSLPDGRAGQPVWVEFLATKGYDYAALVKEDKTELVKIAKGLNA